MSIALITVLSFKNCIKITKIIAIINKNIVNNKNHDKNFNQKKHFDCFVLWL